MGNFTFSIESNEVKERLDRLQQALGDLEAKFPVGRPEPTSFSAEWAAVLADHGPNQEPPYMLSARGEDFIIRNETVGRRPALKMYLDVAGHPTIGYGHEIQRGENFSKGIDEEQARELLREDIQDALQGVNDALDVPLSQEQFDALVDFTFNEGGHVVRRSTLLRTVRAGGAVREHMFTDYDKAGRPLRRSRGLYKRRVREWLLFEHGDYGGGR